MILNFSPLDEPTAREIASWRYQPPYDFYNPDDSYSAILYALDPQNNFYAIRICSGSVENWGCAQARSTCAHPSSQPMPSGLAITAIRGQGGELMGFCSFGKDGQVPGGDYGAVNSLPVLDIGLGMRPDLTGQGRGSDFAAAVLNFAWQQFQAPTFRVTIAAFNLRAQRVWQKNGFRPTQRFIHKDSDQEFIILINKPTN